jgi:hypothetical protein
MKKTILLFVFLTQVCINWAQPVKKYVLIEHFTNSRCSICASRNPAFYNTIGQYSTDIHHISVHPSVPYANCVFYQANTTENNAWAALYGIQGTPVIAMNGQLLGSSNPLLPLATLQNYLNQTSPLYVKVTEGGTGTSRTAEIELRTVGAVPSGNYEVVVAVLEKTINQTTPNGESVHRDVFRKALTTVAGDAVTLPANGQSITLNYNYTVANNWNANEVYILAFVRNATTGEVLNSGTRFDPILSSAGEPLPTRSVVLFPNPANEYATAVLEQDEAKLTELFTLSGQRIRSDVQKDGAQVQINTAALAPGIYLVRITGKKGVYTGKFFKD